MADLFDDDFSAQFDNLPIPCMDSLFFPENDDAEAFPLDLDFGGNADFEITFDDLENLYIPPETDDFVLPDACNLNTPPNVQPGSVPLGTSYDHDVANLDSPESGTSAVDRYVNAKSSESGSPVVPLHNTGDQKSHSSNNVKALNFESHECHSSDRESGGGPVSSQGSGNGGSGVYEAMDSPSPGSGRYDRDISSHGLVDQNLKLEEMGKMPDLKRKIENNDGNIEVKTKKYMRSSPPVENATHLSGLNEENEKRKARLMRNRESAQLSRQRKKHYVEELEEKVKSMHSTITDLSSKISFFMAENATLRQQLIGVGMCPPPPPGMYQHPPMAPMPYPWMPCAPYMVKPQGSQVPLVPIPKLKSQRPVSAPKTKKSVGKKTEGKIKKVASISFLGLFLFILLFGGLVPLVNFKFGGLREDVPTSSAYVSDKYYGQHGEKAWHLKCPRNGSEGDKGMGYSSRTFGIYDRTNYGRGRKLGEERLKQLDPRLRSGANEFRLVDNSSESLAVSLYVPRNDKLVKIDGNLIINSVLASEKAMSFQTVHKKKDKRETGLVISKDWDSALAIAEVGRNRGRPPHLNRSPSEQRKALVSGLAETLKDHMKSSVTDGKMQQWFREGLAGPILSSGMCTEVFHFDASPTPGAIVPASSIANVSAENLQNVTSSHKKRSRRILDPLPDSIPRSAFNLTEEHVVSSQNDNILGNKSTSSMVVSVLVDPKEAGDVDVDGIITPNSLSRIFVVVLVDSVKYVTYSCGLPRVAPHMVTA